MPDLSLDLAPARPANKRNDTDKVDPALLRRAVTAWCELAESAGRPMRRKVARQTVLAHLSGSQTPEEVMRFARNEYGVLDPTAAAAIWNVMRGGR